VLNTGCSRTWRFLWPLIVRVSPARPIVSPQTYTACFSERQVGRVELVYLTHIGGPVLKVQRQSLLPLDLPSGNTRFSEFPPIINVRPRRLLDGIISEYLFAALENAAMQSFFSENSARFRTMEAAHQNIRKKSAELTTLARRMRQEAVTAEILELISGAEALSSV
jgi:F-type H+-transporting ATPase subunit gamma